MSRLSKKVFILVTSGATATAILLAFVPEKEGRSLPAYLDPLGKVTICDGDTHNVRLGDVATPQQCDERLVQNLNDALATVDRCVKAPINPNERAAYGSFALNVGPGAKGVKDGFCVLKSGRQPTFLRKLNAGDHAGACNGLLEWVPDVDGPQAHIRAGLLLRRQQEVEICLAGS
jgi:lysozyme